MTCPDIDRLVDLKDGMELERELQEHLRKCDSCRDDLQVLRELEQAFAPDIEVPNHLSERVLEAMTAPERAPASGNDVRAIDLWIATALGASTVLSAILATGGLGPGATTLELALFTTAGGAVTVWAQMRARRRDSGPALRAPTFQSSRPS